jgi:hypothetical protein
MNEEKKKWEDELNEKFTRDATEITSQPKRVLTGKPEALIAFIQSLLKKQIRQAKIEETQRLSSSISIMFNNLADYFEHRISELEK